jgi:fibronectin-binding autotransporter adhesin
MAAFSAAQAKAFFRMLYPVRKLAAALPGFALAFTNFDATSGVLLTAVGTALTGTTADSFTLASGETDGKFVISVNTTGTNHSVTLKAPVTSQAVTLTLPNIAADTLVSKTSTDTLTNKTLTTPTIGDFTNATHTHASAAQGGAITASASLLGTTNATFTVNYGNATETEIAITSTGTTGGFTATLQVPTLAANRTITFPAVAGTLAILGANTFTAAQTIGTGASIAGSGTGSFDMSGSTGAFTTSTDANTLSGDVTISGSKTLTTGTGAAVLKGSATFDTTKTLTFGSATAGTAVPIIMYSLTAAKGSLRLAAADDASNVATTITNSTSTTGGAVEITLPSATATLATLGLNETFSGNKVITGTLDIRGAVSSGASNPNILFAGSSGQFSTTTGAVTIGPGAIGVTGAVTQTGTTATGITLNGTNATAGIALTGTIADGISIAMTTVSQGLVFVGGTAADSGTIGTAIQIGLTAAQLTLATASQCAIKAYVTTTATSGDNRLAYLRYAITGTGGGGECLRALTSLTAAVGTARGAHISLVPSGSGAVSGQGAALCATLHFSDAGLTTGWLGALQAQIYPEAGGTNGAIHANHGLLWLDVVSGSDDTQAAKILNAMLVTTATTNIGNKAAALMISNADVTGAGGASSGGIAINVNGTRKWLATYTI